MKKKTVNETQSPVEKKEQNSMPTIEPDFDFSENVQKYFESRSEKSAEIKASQHASVDVEEQNEKLKQQYEIERLQREIELHKELKTKAERQLALYRDDYSNLSEEREHFKNRLEKLLPEMEDLQTMNLILMKKMISVDTVLKERGI